MASSAYAICSNSYYFRSKWHGDRRCQRLPDTHAHFAQHGALAFVEVQAHGGMLLMKTHSARLMTMASSPLGEAALAG